MIRAKCDLQIELEQPSRRYRPGETIRGLVRVSVDEDTKCDGLSLNWQWRTHGRGNRTSGPEAGVELFRGQWRPGTYTYPFSLDCPAFPATYHGELLNIDWYLDARADVPWAIDAKTSTDFFVEYRGQPPYEIVSHGIDTSGPSSLLLVILLAPFLLGGVGVLASGLIEDPIGIAFGAFWLVVIGLITIVVLRKRVAKSVFRRFEASVHGGADGQPLVVELDFETNKKVNAVEARLEAEEVVVRGSGTDKTTYRETRFRAGRRELVGAPGQRRLRFELDMPYPGDVGWSFEATDNRLDWYVALDIDIESWPDLEERVGLQLRPRP